MPSPDDYEQYLDSLDERFYIRDSTIHVEFSSPFLIDLNECSSLRDVIQQTRRITVKLIDEPEVDVQYLNERFIRLATKFHNNPVDWRSVAKSIGLIRISDVVYRRNENQLSTNTSLRFENGIGQYAGRHFVQLERVATHENGQSAPAFRITRNMTGMGDGGCEQHTIVSQLDVIETDKHLLLFLPESTSWQYGCQGFESQWYWYYGTRIALKHQFSNDRLEAIQTDIRFLMHQS
jgi:hypothetical protein